ncbi:MAG: NlpC/P60 family protein [Eubacteriales bacterium]
MAVLTVAISAMVTLPILLVPVGLRSGAPAYILVDRAYAAAYPVDPNKKPVLIEDYAISGASLKGSVNGLETNETESTSTDSGTTAETVSPGVSATPAGSETAAGQDGTAPVVTDGAAPEAVDPNAGLIQVGEGQTVSASYLEGEAPSGAADPYAGILTASIVQYADADNIPVELLDTSVFLSDESTFYIQTEGTLIKETPDMASVTVSTINKAKGVTRIGIGDTWSKIRTEDGTEGYVPTYCLSKDMLFIAIDRTVWVDSASLKLRAEPSTGSDIIKTLSQDTPLHCSGISDKWYEVTTSDGTVGYVYVSYTTKTPPPTPTPTPVPKKKTTTTTKTSKSSGKTTGNTVSLPTITGVNGDSIVNICISMLGVPYTWAGESRDGGVDCSGLVVYAYRQIGIGLPHQSNSLVKCGVSISRADIQVGDIVCWDIRGSSDSVEHVGIYVGGGQVIHASSTRDRVEYGNVDMYPIVSIRRIIS